MCHLRAAEWINLLAFSSYTTLAWRRRSLDQATRAKAILIGAVGLAITIFAALLPSRLLSPLAASVTRDWIPYLLLLMFYWQAGQFVTRADTAFEARLEYWDRRLVSPWLEWCVAHPLGTWILGYLELAYMFCYASLPLGLASFYFLHQERAADHFWTVVLLATYPSYGMLPFLQTRPPRALGEKWSAGLPSGRIRAFNLGILRHASIHANTFPSGHVASSLGCALILLRLGPTWVGLGFLWVAVSISLGAVIGRYHYLADAIAAVIVSLAAFVVETVFATHQAVSALISSVASWW
jgi:PAP2 superfamily